VTIIIYPLKRRKLVRLIERSIVCRGDHRRSAGPFLGAGPLAQCHSATPPTGLTG